MANIVSSTLPPFAASSSASISAAAAGYFVDQKKGEINELKQLLKDSNSDRDTKKKRDIIKKVIAYMTLGIDVSRLFTDMVMAIETKDIVIKKMIYLYLCSYAHKEPDMAIMCINTLRRDCDDDDPLVRGLALRSLCSLRLLSILEYIQQPLRKSLGDISAYVRKTGVMSILKLHYLDPSVVGSGGYIGLLMQLLQDPDAGVVTNVIMVLNELNLSQGGMELSQDIVSHLLNRIGDFSEWGLNAVLDLVARYKPSSEDEMFAVMNLLDPVMRTANSGAVLAAINCFLRFTDGFPDLQSRVLIRAKPPLLTLVTGAQHEIQYTVLKHVQLLCEYSACQGVFDDEYRQFFVRYHEPACVKHVKVEILSLIANDISARNITTELGEYVTDVDSELSKKSIVAISRVGIRVASVAAEVVQQLMDLMELDVAYIRTEAVKSLVNILRVFPNVRGHVIPFLPRLVRRVEDDADARGSVLWMLGEYGDEVQEAPYLLERVVATFRSEASGFVRLQTLTAAMKLFFKRPPEVQLTLGLLLKTALEDTTGAAAGTAGGMNQDVHDRALLYYRLLSGNIDVTEEIFKTQLSNNRSSSSSSSSSSSVMSGSLYAQGFAEQRDDVRRRLLMNEFNSLAIVYGSPAAQFVDEEYRLKPENAPLKDFDLQYPYSAGFDSRSSDTTEGVSCNTSTINNKDKEGEGDLLGLLGISEGGEEGVADSVTTAGDLPGAIELALKQGAVTTPHQYQELWSSLADAYSGTAGTFPSQHTAIPTSTLIESILREVNIMTIASGQLNTTAGSKFFLFAQEHDDFLLGGEGPVYLAMMSCFEENREIQLQIRTNHSVPSKASMAFLRVLLGQLTRRSVRAQNNFNAT